MLESRYDQQKTISMKCSKKESVESVESQRMVRDIIKSEHKIHIDQLKAGTMPTKMSTIQTSYIHESISKGLIEEENIGKTCDQDKTASQQNGGHILENGAHNLYDDFEDINENFEGINHQHQTSEKHHLNLSGETSIVNNDKIKQGTREVQINQRVDPNIEGTNSPIHESVQVNGTEKNCENNNANDHRIESQNESESIKNISKMRPCKNPKRNSDFTDCVNAVKPGRYLRKFAIGPGGGICVLSSMGVCLAVPSGALTSARYIFIGLSKNGHDFPDFSDGGHMYGPIIVCGPHGLKFEKPVYLMFQHSLVLTSIEDHGSLPTLHHSETGLLSDNAWQPYSGTVGLTSHMVVATIQGFTKFVWRTIGDTLRSRYRVLRTMVVLEAEMLEESGGSVAVHVYVVDAEDAEEQYVLSHAKGSVVARSTFLFSETPGKGLSLQLIPSESFSLRNCHPAEIIEYEDILDNLVGLKNHVTFNLLKKSPGQGTHESFECEVRVTQLDGYSETTQVVRNIVKHQGSPKQERDSGVDQDILPGAASCGHGDTPMNPGNVEPSIPNLENPPVVANAEPALSNRGNRNAYRRCSQLQAAASDSPTQTLNKRAKEQNPKGPTPEHLEEAYCEQQVLKVLKPGEVISLKLPLSLRTRLEHEMDTGTVTALADYLKVTEPEQWGVSALLYYFEAIHTERQEALSQLTVFFQSVDKCELAEACKGCRK